MSDIASMEMRLLRHRCASANDNMLPGALA
jgi:hypothetical protein